MTDLSATLLLNALAHEGGTLSAHAQREHAHWGAR